MTFSDSSHRKTLNRRTFPSGLRATHVGLMYSPPSCNPSFISERRTRRAVSISKWRGATRERRHGEMRQETWRERWLLSIGEKLGDSTEYGVACDVGETVTAAAVTHSIHTKAQARPDCTNPPAIPSRSFETACNMHLSVLGAYGLPPAPVQENPRSCTVPYPYKFVRR